MSPHVTRKISLKLVEVVVVVGILVLLKKSGVLGFIKYKNSIFNFFFNIIKVLLQFFLRGLINDSEKPNI